MPKLRLSLVLLSLIFTPIALMTASQAGAAESTVASGYSIVTSPVSLNLVGKPGTRVVSEIRVKNNASVAQTLAMSANRFKADGESGKALIVGVSDDDPTLKWVSFSPQKFDAQPGTWVTIKVTFDLPASAAFGYYYALRVSPAAAPIPEGGKAKYAGSNAILALLDVDTPNSKRLARVETFESLHGIYEFLPANFTTRIENIGNVHVAPVGNIFIMQGSKQIGSLDFNTIGGNILPSSKRTFSDTWSDGFPVNAVRMKNGSPVRDKANNPIYDLKWDFTQLGKVRFGKYTAKFVGSYTDRDGKSIELDAATDFWVIPWRLLLILFGVLFFAGVGIYVTVTKAANRAKHRKG